MLVWLAGFFFGAQLCVSHLVWSGVGSTCGYYRVVVSGCIRLPVLYCLYPCIKWPSLGLSVSVHVHCSGLQWYCLYRSSMYPERFVRCDVLRLWRQLCRPPGVRSWVLYPLALVLIIARRELYHLFALSLALLILALCVLS